MNPGDNNSSATASAAPIEVENCMPARRARSEQQTFLFRESHRLRTYLTWPKEHIAKGADLAAAGLFYSGYNDKVTCPWCRGSLANWQPGDSPVVEHRRHFASKCPFVQGKSVGNVPLSEEGCASVQHSGILISTDRIVQHLDFADPQARLASFIARPATQNVEDMVDAGFFSLQQLDKVRCYSCRVVFCDWQAGMDPWVVHAQHAPTCHHVRTVKGTEFIGNVTRAASKRQAELAAAAAAAAPGANGETSESATAPVDSKDITKELKQLQNQLVCKVCMDSKISRVFVPCGHFVCCDICTPLLRKCPVCRANIAYVVNTFMS